MNKSKIENNESLKQKENISNCIIDKGSISKLR